MSVRSRRAAIVRNVAAFLLFPFPPALARAFIVWRSPNPVGGIFAHPASMFAAMCLGIYVVELVLGAPILLALRRNGRERLFDYALAGLAILAIPSLLVVAALSVQRGHVFGEWRVILFVGLTGPLAGALYWALARLRARDYSGVFD
jgi:hypothetical protein